MAKRAPKAPDVTPETTAGPTPGNNGLPEKRTYRLSEVAAYYDVDERTVRLWIEHGHLKVEYTPAGVRRVTAESLNLCRFRPKALRSGPF